MLSTGQLLREGCVAYLSLCFPELLLVGKSILRSVRIKFKLSCMITAFVYDLGQIS